MNISPSEARAVEPPFDAAKLDRLMEEAGIDVLLATSKHNTQYLLGGYKFIFFAAMDAIGHSRYLPIVVYEKGSPDHSAYVGNRMEGENTRTTRSGHPRSIRRPGVHSMRQRLPSST